MKDTSGIGQGRLQGKRAFIAGGAVGIGAEIARRFADEGARVVVGDAAPGGDVLVDVSSRESVEAAVPEAVDRLGGLDTLVCHAGRAIPGPLHELDEAEWDAGLATNLKGVYLCVKAAWQYLAESRGSIISTASVAGLWASPRQAAYNVSKAGIIMLTKCLALDGAKAGIRANCVCPGAVESPMLERYFARQPDPDAARDATTARHPLGRVGRPLDIADAFVYLASDEASWVTGTALVVDGGSTSGFWSP